MSEVERAAAKDQAARNFIADPKGEADPVHVLGAFGTGFDAGWHAATKENQ